MRSLSAQLRLALAPIFVLIVVMAMPNVARAGTDTYPTSIAGCRSITSPYSPSHPGPSVSCDLKDSAQDSYYDPWGEESRECTSATAWWLSSINGFTMPFHDDASGWGQDAKNLRYTVNMNPAQGAVIWFQPADHVGWVESVSADGKSVTYQDYNSDYKGHYGEHTVATSSASGYIHFKDLPSGEGSGSGTTHPFIGSDVDANHGSDLILTTAQPGGGSAAQVLLSTFSQFWMQGAWWSDPSVGWGGITPLVGDVNGDGFADYVFLANSGNGTVAYVALNNQHGGFYQPQVWWNGVGWGYSGIKASLGDVDGNHGEDLILTTAQPSGGSAAYVLLSTFQKFLAPKAWWSDPSVGWAGITPLVGDVNGDGYADYVFLANSGAGTMAYVAINNAQGANGGFYQPQPWWNGVGWGYNGIKATLGNVDGGVDGNKSADLILTTNQPSGGTAVYVLRSTYLQFMPIELWWSAPSVGWSGITPMTGDLNGDHNADYVYLADNNGLGSRAYVLLSDGHDFNNGPWLWWDGLGWGYSGIKPVLR